MDDIGCVYMYSTHVMDMQKIQTKIFPWGSDQSSPYKHVWEKNCRAEKKGIPFYTFRINKHFSVKYDQVSGTDVIFLRQGIQLIPVKGSTHHSRGVTYWQIYSHGWHMSVGIRAACRANNRKQIMVNVSVCFSAICKCY